jgi:mannuronan 5-epimerase
MVLLSIILTATLLLGAICAFLICWYVAKTAAGANASPRAYVAFIRTSLSLPPTPTSGIPLKDTNYPIPAGAFFVAPNGNNAQPGTQAAPWRTLAHAVATAPSGATIVLRQGTYRESVTLFGKALTLQPYPHERVFLNGASVVAGWVADGTRWRKDGWTAQFKQGGLPADFLDPAYPLAAFPDMAFLNGQPLGQVASKAAVTAGTFYVDYAAKQLFIGDNPSGKTVEAATLAQALDLTLASGSTIRGLGIIHYATHRDQNGAIKANSARLTFENNTFGWNAASGLTVLGADIVVRGNSFLYNGQAGVVAYKADRLLLEQNYIANNNMEHFKWEAGGVKVFGGRDMICRDNLVEGNLWKGLWWDGSAYNTTIVRNVVRNNSQAGIMYEVSAKVIIASNVVVNNKQQGIYVPEAEDVDVYNNTLVNNQENMRVFEGDRVNSDPLITWNVRDVVIRNNLLSNSNDPVSGTLLSVYSSKLVKSAEQMGVSTNYNAYYRTNGSLPPVEVMWVQVGSLLRYQTFAAFRAATGQEANGLAIDNVAANPFFVNEASGDYHLKAGSPASGRGTPLSTQIANAIGVSAGVPVDIGALKW